MKFTQKGVGRNAEKTHTKVLKNLRLLNRGTMKSTSYFDPFISPKMGIECALNRSRRIKNYFFWC